jgi:hypothetical protein
MAVGDEFSFICDGKMAEKIGRVVVLNSGEIVGRTFISSGVSITVRKNDR